MKSRVRRFLAVVLSLVLFVNMPTFATAAGESSAEWSGNIKKPTQKAVFNGNLFHIITTPEELAYIAQAGREWLNYNYVLANDIVLNAETITYDSSGKLTTSKTGLREWTPIGNYGEEFKGIFDGNGHTISGVYFNNQRDYAGLFGYAGGRILNLNVTNSYIKGNDGVGGISGQHNGQVFDCTYDGAVVGSGVVGGIVGYVNGSHDLMNCENYGDVWSTNICAGGIVGRAYINVRNCHNTGNVNSEGEAGGIAGFCQGDITDCSNKGNVKGDDGVGGISGSGAIGYIARSYNTGAIRGRDRVGGILGYAENYGIMNSYNVGSVVADKDIVAGGVYGDGAFAVNCYYLKSSSVNANITGRAGYEDIERAVEGKGLTFFPILLDPEADPSYENLGSIVPTTSREWDGTIKKPAKQVLVEDTLYYEISTPQELAYIAQTGGEWLEYNYILTEDIVLNEETLTYDDEGYLTIDDTNLNKWTPIGNYGAEFNGIFEGNLHTISGVYVEDVRDYAGLFGYAGGRVQNLSVTNSYIRGNDAVGGISGQHNGIVANCDFDGAVIGSGIVGGLVGYMNGSHDILDCENYGDVWSTNICAGGIVGHTFTSITRSYNGGAVNSQGIAGGIAGFCQGDITYCGNKGDIMGDDCVGGIAGSCAKGYISNSYSTGMIIGRDRVGGVLGYSEDYGVMYSYNAGSVVTISKGIVGGVYGEGAFALGCYYLKNSSVNASITGRYGYDDAVRVVEGKDAEFFPILSDPYADPSYDNLGKTPEVLMPTATPEPTATPLPTDEPSPAPKATDEPLATGEIVRIDFDSAELGARLPQLSGTNWTGGANEANYHANCKVVAKSDIFTNADVTDYCMEFKPLTLGTKSMDLNFSIVLDEAVRPTLSDKNASGYNSVAIEMEVAITGTDKKVKGFRINLNDGAKSVNYSIARFAMYEDYFGHYTSESKMQNKADCQSSTEGEFHTLKVVIDRKTCESTYYWDGQLAGSDINAIHEEKCLTFGHIRFQLPYENSTKAETDSRLYVDNVRVYYPDQVASAPTQAPMMFAARPKATSAPVQDNCLEIDVNNNCLDSNPVTITAPVGGWVKGDNTFTVACEDPCYVAVSYDGGETYNRVDAVAVSEGYSFTVAGMTEDTLLSIGYVGDVNGDGIVSNSDATRLAAIYAGKTSASGALMNLLCDVNNDGEMTNADVTGLNANYADKKNLNW